MRAIVTYFFLPLLLLLVFASGSRAALTLVHREPFQGVGTITSANPGANLGTVTGSLFKRPGGPRVVGDTTVNSEGWSADVHDSPSANNTWNIAYSPGFSGMACGWFFLSTYTTDGGGRMLKLISVGLPNTNLLSSIMLNDQYQLMFFSSYDSNPATVPAPPNGWVFLAIAWVNDPSTGLTSARTYYQLPGGKLTQLGDQTSAGGATSLSAMLGEGLYTSADSVQLRYGCPSLYTMSSYADVAVPSDVVPPSTTSLSWYLNPVTGNDNNDGTSRSTAWQTLTKLNAETANLGMFPTNGSAPLNITGTAAGNILYIDCSAGSVPEGSTSLTIQTAGLSIKETQVSGVYGGTPKLGGNGIDPMTTMTAKSWTAVSGATNVWKSTDGGATDLTSTVLFEDGRYMSHPTGATLSAVQSSLSATPGSFWTDGTTMYVHSFEGGNPNSDGHLYRRTRYRDGAGDSAVNITAPNVWWDGFVCAGTTLANKQTNDPVNAACLQWAGENGTGLLSNFNINNYSKHGIGRTTGPGSGISMTLNRQNGVYGQGTPYAGVGGASADVDYSGSAKDSNCAATFTNCSETVNCGLIGSTTGTVSTSILSYITHNSGNAFISNLTFNNCHFVGALDDQASCQQITCENMTCYGTLFDSPSTFDRCTTNGNVLANIGAPCIIRNCIMVCPYSGTGYVLGQLGASTTILGTVFDLRATPSGVGVGNPGNRFGAIYGKAVASSSLTVENCLFLGSSAGGFTSALTYGFGSSDSLILNHNAYATYGDAVDGAISYNGSGLVSFSAWQSMGFEANSFLTTNPLITNYVPQKGSPLVNAGINLIGLIPPINTDFTGAVFPYRSDIGAYQTDFFTPQSVSGFPASELVSASTSTITLPARTSAGLVITYVLVFGPARISGDTLTITGPGTIVIAASQPGNSTYAAFNATVTLIVPGATDTPTMQTWALILFGSLLALTAMRSLRA